MNIIEMFSLWNVYIINHDQKIHVLVCTGLEIVYRQAERYVDVVCKGCMGYNEWFCTTSITCKF